MDKQSKSTEWYTPEKILERIRKYFGGVIPLDPATVPTNPTGAITYFTEKEDGLSRSWDEGTFVNPPYGRRFPEWCRKIGESAIAGTEIIALLPCGARFSTSYFQLWILGNPRLTAVCFVKGRVKFTDQNRAVRSGNPYDSAIYGFNVDAKQFSSAFISFGKVWLLRSIQVEINGERCKIARRRLDAYSQTDLEAFIG